MKKTIFILLIVVVGIGVWFYLLLGKNEREENIVEQEPRIISTEEKQREQPPQKNIPIPEGVDAPANTDAGMEFPVLQ